MDIGVDGPHLEDDRAYSLQTVGVFGYSTSGLLDIYSPNFRLTSLELLD